MGPAWVVRLQWAVQDDPRRPAAAGQSIASKRVINPCAGTRPGDTVRKTESHRPSVESQWGSHSLCLSACVVTLKRKLDHRTAR